MIKLKDAVIQTPYHLFINIFLTLYIFKLYLRIKLILTK